MRFYFPAEIEQLKNISKYEKIVDQIVTNLINRSFTEIHKETEARKTVDRLMRSKTNQYLPEARDLIQKYANLKGGRKL